LCDVGDRGGVQVVELLPAPPHGGDQIGLFQDPQVLADGLPGHAKAGAQLLKRLAVAGVESVQELASARVGERPEDVVHGSG
jgi:hypothetical protein